MSSYQDVYSHSLTPGHQYDFEELITKVAKEIDVIVPVVSLKEVSREDWRHLPALIKNGMGRPADIVVCTHLDQASAPYHLLCIIHLNFCCSMRLRLRSLKQLFPHYFGHRGQTYLTTSSCARHVLGSAVAFCDADLQRKCRCFLTFGKRTPWNMKYVSPADYH